MVAAVMGSPIDNDHIIDASVAFAIVVLVQAAYCTLRWRTRAATRLRWWILFAGASIFGTIALVFLALGAASQRGGSYNLAYAMLICSQATSVLSIWCFEVFDVLYPSKDGWLLLARPPFSDWGSLIFWSGLVIQCLFVILGLWSIASFRIEFLWATPVISHINIAVIAVYALRSTYGVKSALLRLWVVAGVAATFTSVAFCIIATCAQVAGHAPVQCLSCALILSVKAYRDWDSARDRQQLPQDEPRVAPFAWCDATNRYPKAPSPVALHHSQRCNSGVGLIPLEPATSYEVSLSSSTTAPSEACHLRETGKMQFPDEPFSVFRVDRQMIEYYSTIHAFFRQIDGDRLMPEAVGKVSSVLDVGAGTGDWALDMAAAQSDMQVVGTDLARIQPHYTPYKVAFYVEDANRCNWAWHRRFDYIHFRNMDGGIKDWGVTLNAAFACLATEGFLSLSDLIFHQPPCNITPGGIWDEWQQALDALKAETGLSFGLHENERAKNELKKSGYTIVDEKRRSFQLRQKSHVYDDCDLLQGIIEQMKGVFWRALEFRPGSVNKQRLVNQLEEEVWHGLEITVATIVAQKPAIVQPAPDCGKSAAVDAEE
ncbi:hypothetical protein BGZ61DRAFT_177988 [Ilyonectria robusta]|uniref:uncharacterized protein n=1 Tax=Ilyonectria robusta TaxID=1079257 RepID=UPI001E8EE4A7|nr:uncharacterized protein BGZ61DRAFT_177988 [Ilyonectria robusta]KAH8729190.1 hypothetical protein BGZ61DRAFT_177988 [Ilyonectria robusta]